jgi:hypothetical protein
MSVGSSIHGLVRAAVRRSMLLASLGAWVGCGQADSESVGSVTSPLCAGASLTANPTGPIPSGSVVELTAKTTSCGAGETPEYRFLIRRDGATTTYTELRPYSTDPKFQLNTTGLAAGKYSLQVYARAVGRISSRDSTASLDLLIGPTCSSVTFSASPGSPQLPGPTVQISPSALCSEGATAEHRLFVQAPGGSSYTLLGGFSSGPFSWNTSGLATGPYSLMVRSRAVGNSSGFEASRTLPFRLGATCTQVQGTFSPAKSAPLGSVVTLDASATCTAGTPADYQFAFRPKGTGAYQTIASWGPGSAVWQTAGLAPGAYDVLLSARASDYAGSAQVTKLLAYQLGGLCISVTIAATPQSPQQLGSPLTLTGSANCAGAPAEYRFLYKDALASTYTEIAPWSTSASVSFNTQGVSPGLTAVSVEARAKDSGPKRQASQDLNYLLGDVCHGVSMSASPPSPEPAGTPITLSAAAQCAFGGVPEYRFSHKPASSNTWQIFRDYAPQAVAIVPGNLATGAYNFRVQARGQQHLGLAESSRSISYKLGSPCPAGYQSNGNDSCVDINECQANSGGCDALTSCSNTPGGFECGPCPAGFSGDGASGCQDIDECATNDGGCHGLTTCSNTQGGYLCSSCPEGYSGNGTSGCVDINECALNNGGCDLLTQCTNTPGSFGCGPCPAGYTGNGADGCTDVNECSTNNGGCDPLTSCNNTPGSFACGPCPPGYGGNGADGCTDINECSTSNGGCDPLTVCNNTPGGSSCGPCPAGYAGNGSDGCTDVNECSSNNGGCDPLTSCINSPGSHSCGPCPPGYGGSGATGCIAPSPCNPNPCQNGGTCSENGASFSCSCVNGFGGASCEIAPVKVLTAGDIGDCNVTNDTATGLLLDARPGTILPLGDIAYPNGSTSNFTNCFHPVWGAHKSRMRPVPGNHEYNTAGAAGYYAYFGTAAGDPTKGYYSYNLGTWHIVALNSNCSAVSCSAGSVQETWLRQDLAANPTACTLAYFHHPRFSSGGEHGNSTTMSPIWKALVDHGVEIALAGHDHNYERFAPQLDNAAPAANGVVQFVVGTGGTNLRPLATPFKANSVARNATDHGLLELTLAAGSYSWAFVPVAGKSYSDSGTTTCH